MFGKPLIPQKKVINLFAVLFPKITFHQLHIPAPSNSAFQFRFYSFGRLDQKASGSSVTLVAALRVRLSADTVPLENVKGTADGSGVNINPYHRIHRWRGF